MEYNDKVKIITSSIWAPGRAFGSIFFMPKKSQKRMPPQSLAQVCADHEK
jgi:hypothetical protein